MLQMIKILKWINIIKYYKIFNVRDNLMILPWKKNINKGIRFQDSKLFPSGWSPKVKLWIFIFAKVFYVLFHFLLFYFLSTRKNQKFSLGDILQYSFMFYAAKLCSVFEIKYFTLLKIYKCWLRFSR